MIAIRKMNPSDIEELSKIWLDASVKAHDFISASYWKENKILMQEHYLPNAEVYVAEEPSHILGFVALMDNHIAAIFVKDDYQGQGIGSTLLNYSKSLRQELTLNVYQQNKNSTRFYLSNGFKVVEENVDQATNEKEYVMHWHKPSQQEQTKT